MHVMLTGAGNIGSHAAELVARIEAVTRMTVIDRDRYEMKNLGSQAIGWKDVGKPKAQVVARRLRALRKGLKVEAIEASVEEVPENRLRGDVLLGAVDTRWTRQYLNEAAWNNRIPYVDAGVMAPGDLVRIDVLTPGEDQACIECEWDQRHYDTIETPHPCQIGRAPHSTNAPASLGALAGALMAIECRKLAGGGNGASLAGKRLVIDAAWHKQHITVLRRNPRCRFHHRIGGQQHA
jgi:hypothetical protein